MAAPVACPSLGEHLSSIVSSFECGDDPWLAVIPVAQGITCKKTELGTTLLYRGDSVPEKPRLAELLNIALVTAVSKNLTDYVALLLARGASPNVSIAGDEFSLKWRGYVSQVDLLIICAKWKCGYVETARFLLRYGATVKFRVLDLCVRHQHLELLRVLYAHGVDMNMCDEVQCTALHLCAKRGNVFAAKLLVRELGANVNARTVRGDTVEDVARRHGQAAFIEWLYMNNYVKVPASSTAIAKRCYNFDRDM